LSFASIFAQDIFYPEQHELIQLKNSWLNTNNAAGLTISDVALHGNTELGYSNAGGNYHRAQEGNRLNGLRFFSERFNKIGKNWISWGSFEFQMNREYERNWSNVFNTYNSSPYIFGDSIKANYDTQFFDLHAKLSRKINNKLAFGIGIDYFAADMSRLRDARTRTYVANYAAIPSLTYKLTANQVIGLTAGIRFDKEKMPGTTTVQESPKIVYYLFLGNENANSVIDGYKGFDRQFVNLDYSVGLQHSITGKDFDWYNGFEYITKKQEVLGSERESPGSYFANKFSFKSIANIKTEKRLLNISFDGYFNEGWADEYLQERIEERDTLTGNDSKEWVTLYSYTNRYVTDSYQGNLKVSVRNLLSSGKDYSWVAGADAQFNGFNNKYYLPYSSIENQRLRIGGNVGVRILNIKNHRVTVNLKGGYGFRLKNDLQLNSISTTIPSNSSSMFEKAAYKVANQIIIPDMEFYKQNVVDYRIDARYSFPLTISKNKLVGSAKLFYGKQISETYSSWFLDPSQMERMLNEGISKKYGSWMLFGFSIGLITL
jgi:hypothetical protein